MSRLSYSLLLVIVLGVASFSTGRVVHWTGLANNSDQNWHDPANWDIEAVPTSTDDVIISLKERYDIYLYDTAPIAYAHSLVLDTAEIIASGPLIVFGPVVGNNNSQVEVLAYCAFGDVKVDTFIVGDGGSANVTSLNTNNVFLLSSVLNIGTSHSTTQNLAIVNGGLFGTGATFQTTSLVFPSPQFLHSTKTPASLIPMKKQLYELSEKYDNLFQRKITEPKNIDSIVSGVEISTSTFFMSKVVGEQDLVFQNGGTIVSGF